MKPITHAFVTISVALLSASALAVERVDGWSIPRVVPVSDVNVVVFTGCGQPNPNGCPDETQVNFTVASGGLCHKYSVQISAQRSGTVLTVLDSMQSNCTRPEEINHKESVSLRGSLGRNPVVLGNPIYIKRYVRP
ncbi:MAG: hypothetical protein ACXVBE_03650 [Bdellovibrionota bacterium]